MLLPPLILTVLISGSFHGMNHPPLTLRFWARLYSIVWAIVVAGCLVNGKFALPLGRAFADACMAGAVFYVADRVARWRVTCKK
jgi:hypothetical protein